MWQYVAFHKDDNASYLLPLPIPCILEENILYTQVKDEVQRT